MLAKTAAMMAATPCRRDPERAVMATSYTLKSRSHL
jgi:hypothetical protein